MEEFRRTNRELVAKGSIIDYYQDTVIIPNGNIAKWDFVNHKGAAAVVPVTENGTILMVRQYRNAIDRYSLEIPAGGKNGIDEPTLTAAARELEEETGFIADKLEFLISIVTSLAYSNEVIDIYVAHGLRKTKQNLDEDEFINVVEMEVEDLIKMIYSGEIQDAKTISAIMSYKNKYR